jgi:hypothetical protein
MTEQETKAAVEPPLDYRVMRLRRKLELRDRKIEGLKKRVAILEMLLATREIEAKRLPLDVARAVQDALCNIRMIPVLGVGRGDRTVEVKAGPAHNR